MNMLSRVGGRCCTEWSRVRKVVSSTSFRTKVCADWKEFPKPVNFASKYDERAIKQILDVLNNTSLEEFTRYNITKGRRLKIVKHRETNGPFKTIEQVLEVDDFGAKILEKLVVSITEGGSNETADLDQKPRQKILNNFATPILTSEKRRAIDTITGVYIGRQHISWAKIDTGGCLLAWDSYANFEFSKKDNPMVLHDLALKIRERLPASDVYVTEAPPSYQTVTINQMNAIVSQIQCLQLTTMLVTLIATQFKRLNENGTANLEQIDNCYFLRRDAPARLFGLVIGNEIVSARAVINQILDDTIKNSLKHISPITIDRPENDVYQKGSSVKKEALAQALLLSVAFMDLAVVCNPGSLKVLENNRPTKIY